MDQPRTVLALARSDRIVIVAGIPVVGLLVGLLVPALARWALDLPWGLPMRPVFRVVGAVDRPWEVAVNLAIWFAAALVVVRSALTDGVRVTLTDDEVRLDRSGWSRTIRRTDIDAVFVEGRRLVALDRASRRLVREAALAPAAALAAGFRAHGYPWRDADPYEALYRRWWPDSPELPPAVNAVLAARELALRRRAADEVRDLAEATERLGFAVRDEGARQYWRPLVRS